MGKQKKYADRRLPKGFASWEEFARHGVQKRKERQKEIERLAEIGKQAERSHKSTQ